MNQPEQRPGAKAENGATDGPAGPAGPTQTGNDPLAPVLAWIERHRRGSLFSLVALLVAGLTAVAAATGSVRTVVDAGADLVDVFRADPTPTPDIPRATIGVEPGRNTTVAEFCNNDQSQACQDAENPLTAWGYVVRVHLTTTGGVGRQLLLRYAVLDKTTNLPLPAGGAARRQAWPVTSFTPDRSLHEWEGDIFVPCPPGRTTFEGRVLVDLVQADDNRTIVGDGESDNFTFSCPNASPAE